MMNSVHRGVSLIDEYPENSITVQDIVDAIKRSTFTEYARFEKGKLLSHSAPILQVAITVNHTQGNGMYSILFTEDGMFTGYTDKVSFEDCIRFKKVPNLDLSKINHIDRFRTIYKYKCTLDYNKDGVLEDRRLDVDIIRISIFLNGIRRKSDCMLAKIKANEKYLSN